MNAYTLLTRAKNRSHSNHVASYLNELWNELCKRIECLEATENSPAHKYTITKKTTTHKNRSSHIAKKKRETLFTCQWLCGVRSVSVNARDTWKLRMRHIHSLDGNHHQFCGKKPSCSLLLIFSSQCSLSLSSFLHLSLPLWLCLPNFQIRFAWKHYQMIN